MAPKTYIPGAVDAATFAHKYLSRWQSVMLVGATSGQVTALANLITCLAQFLVDWKKPPVNP
jgi:hypothetical protein